jgi:hypothetical protein
MIALFIALNGAPAALAQSDEDRQACVNDALQLCQDAIPDRERVFGCLVSHKDQLSPACHAVMARAQAAEEPPLKKPVARTKSAKGKVTFAKRTSKPMSGTSAKRASKPKAGTAAKRASKPKAGTAAKHASKAASGTAPKHASKAPLQRNRRPLSRLPH